jgi:hypothetical protein
MDVLIVPKAAVGMAKATNWRTALRDVFLPVTGRLPFVCGGRAPFEITKLMMRMQKQSVFTWGRLH